MIASEDYTPDRYAGNGSTTTFPVTFDFSDASDLSVVSKNDTTLIETPWIKDGAGTTGYSVSGTDVEANIAPATGVTLIVSRLTPKTQGTDFKANVRTPAGIEEDAFDKLTLMMQEEDELSGRCLKFGGTSLFKDVDFPDLVANKIFQVNAAGDGFILADAAVSSDAKVNDLFNSGFTYPIYPLRVEVGEANLIITSGAGSPEGVVTAKIGSIYMRNNGGVDTSVYFKESDGSGNTGWVTRSSVPTGASMPFRGAAAPAGGWLLEDGAAHSRTTYATLFAVIGTAYGVGDGSTTFNVPDTRGRTNAGLDNLGGTSANRVTDAQADVLGGVVGDEEHTLLEAEMPTHNHDISHTHPAVMQTSTNGYADVGGLGSTTGSNLAHIGNSGNKGSGSAHNNMQPTIFMTSIIKT